MSVNAIVAIDSNLGIGYEDGLPWPHNKKDMQWFRENTTGHVIVMGRKTWETFGCKKLPNRVNVVVSSKDVDGPDLLVNGDMKNILEMLEEKYSHLDIFVIGGADVYRQALPYCDKLYVTCMKSVYKCDTFMYNKDFEGFGVQEYIDADKDLTIQIRRRE